jgi:hypothetical protein
MSDAVAQPMALKGGKHVMLSYNWNSQDIVEKVYNILNDAGIPTWMDIHGGMKDNTYIRYSFDHR